MKIGSLKKAAIACGLICSWLGGCATAGRSVALGGAVGAGSGVAIGAIADPGHKGEFRTRNVVIGGMLGAMGGVVAGSLIHSANKSREAKAFKAGQMTAQPIASSEQPKLIPAQWRARIVDAKRIGNRFVPRHVEYIITKPARWEDPQ